MNIPYISKALRAFGASLAVVGIIALCANPLFAQVSGDKSAPDKLESENQRMTREAWDEYKLNHFEIAIMKAEDCILLFRRAAAAKQDELKKKPEPEPPIGAVSDLALREKIFSWGQLNDGA